jgi:hypothetical protein
VRARRLDPRVNDPAIFLKIHGERFVKARSLRCGIVGSTSEAGQTGFIAASFAA